MLLVDVVACEDVETVAPTIPAHHLCILHRYRVAATNRQLSGKRTVDKNILRVSHHYALVVSRHHNAVSKNLDIT